LQEHSYFGPPLSALTENISQTDYLPNPAGTGKKPYSKYRKPSRLAIYEAQYYTPENDGCLGTTRRDRAELDPYRALLDRLHDPAADFAEVTEDETTPWDRTQE